MNIFKTIFSLLFLVSGMVAGNLQAQIIQITPLNGNPELLQKAADENQSIDKDFFPHSSNYFFQYDTLALPFVDDFSGNQFMNHNTSLYTGIFLDQVKYWQVLNAVTQPDTIWYVYNQPDSFFVVGGAIDSVTVSDLSAIQIIIFDSIVNPYHVAETLEVYRYQPRLVMVGGIVNTVLNNVDGQLKNVIDTFSIAPHQAWDHSLWIDDNVYRNFGMAVSPPTIGVVTFDGINRVGTPYDMSNPSAYGVADFLTSKPLRLGGLSPSDSVYISFFYQAQGLGFYPAPKDSLVLEFFSPISKSWNWAWSRKGELQDTFKQVMVPVLNAEYFNDGFQFRFKNYANLSANKDHWMIDYVRLDKNRNMNDTTMDDLAIVTTPPSILKNYMQMPYNQFKQADVNQKFGMQFINLATTNKCMVYEHTFYLKNTFTNTDDSLTSYPYDNIPTTLDTSCVRPVYTDGYDKNFRHYLPSFSYQFDTDWPSVPNYPPLPFPDSIDFYVQHKIRHFIDTINDVLTNDAYAFNDSAYYHQKFHNYYAYDDGGAEVAVFLGQPGEIAYKFTLNKADTLRAIQIYFNPQLQNIQSNFFELKVWNTLSDNSEDTLYTQTSVQPLYMPSAPNYFTTYILTRPVKLNAGDFYIGWQQNSNFKMNVGYDRNHEQRPNMFYRTTGNWDDFTQAIPEEGCLMMRPITGKPVTPEMFLGTPVLHEPQQYADVEVFPNPANLFIQYRLPENTGNHLKISLFDISGKVHQTHLNPSGNSLDVSDLNPGVYFLRFEDPSTQLLSIKKVIVSR